MVRLNDALLARLALVLAVFGVAALGILVEVQKPVDADISELGEMSIGSRVSVKGSVAEIFKARNALVFTVYDGNFVKAVVFSPSEEEREIVRKGNIVEIRGRLQNYKGELEIIAEQVREVSEPWLLIAEQVREVSEPQVLIAEQVLRPG